jgi:hypothetical protein
MLMPQAKPDHQAAGWIEVETDFLSQMPIAIERLSAYLSNSIVYYGGRCIIYAPLHSSRLQTYCFPGIG